MKFIFEIHFEIFESAKKNWRIEKYSDTCGRGAKACWQVELPKYNTEPLQKTRKTAAWDRRPSIDHGSMTENT